MNDIKRILVIVLGLIVVSISIFGIKGHTDSTGYKKQVNYTTALQATDAEKFNYIVDSQQGRVLASGKFSSQNYKPAKFDEMNKTYTIVSRTQQHYTMHTREVCSSSGKTTSCHTEIYYTWDNTGIDRINAQNIDFMDRSYPLSIFNFDKFTSDTNCNQFSNQGTGTGWLQTKHGCIDGAWYIDDDNRYVYSTVPVTFSAAFMATTYGGLKPFQENAITLQDKSIEQILKDVGKYHLIGFWIVTCLLIVLFIIAAVGAYAWVMADGQWSLKE